MRKGFGFWSCGAKGEGSEVVLLFWLQRSAINLTMSSHQMAPSQRRTSERRRLKLLRNANEYRMANPFRNPHALPFPHSLFHQLRKIEFLSSSAIAQLSFDGRAPDQEHGEVMLARMHEAALLQQFRCASLLGPPPPSPLHSQQQEEELEKGEGEEVVQTKDEVTRNIYDPRDPRRQQQFACEALLGEAQLGTVRGQCTLGLGLGGAVLAEEEYQNYFAN